MFKKSPRFQNRLHGCTLFSDHQFNSLFFCLDRNASKLKKVRVVTTRESDTDKLMELFKILVWAENIEELTIVLSYWKFELREKFELIAPILPIPKKSFTIEIVEPIWDPDDVARTIAAICPSIDGLPVVINISMPIEIGHLAPRLFIKYGSVISTLRCRIKTARDVERFVHFLSYCTSVRTLHLYLCFRYEDVLPLESPLPVIQVPHTVENLVLTCSNRLPSVKINSPYVEVSLFNGPELKLFVSDIKCLTINN